MSGSLAQEELNPFDDILNYVADPNDLTEVSQELARTQALRDEYDRAVTRLKERADQLLDALGVATEGFVFSSPVDGEKKIIKRVTPEVTKVNLALLRDRCGQAAVDQVTQAPKVVVSKWENALETGAIPMEVAAECATYEPGTSYVRVYKAD